MTEQPYNGTGDNSKDPMKQATPENERRMLQAFGKVAAGAPNEVVLGAAINLLVNCLRQCYPTFNEAESRLNDRVGVAKDILRASYDQITGARRSVFAFDQVIMPGLVRANDDKFGHR